MVKCWLIYYSNQFNLLLKMVLGDNKYSIIYLLNFIRLLNSFNSIYNIFFTNISFSLINSNEININK